MPPQPTPSRIYPASKAIVLNEIDVGQQLPTIGGAIIRAHNNGTKLIVIGYRKHRVAEHADIFLNIKPNTEGFLYAAMAKIIIDRGIMDLDFIPPAVPGTRNSLTISRPLIYCLPPVAVTSIRRSSRKRRLCMHKTPRE